MDPRNKICEVMRSLVASGLNRSTSGNVSIRDGDGMLVTPSGIPVHDLKADMIAWMSLDSDGEFEGPLVPSVEWRFHRDLLRERPEFGAVVHSHSPWCTVLSCARTGIPAIHYMIAAFGGTDVRVANYATYGTPELSAGILEAMKDRSACLMANHGVVVGGKDIDAALWLSHEIEALAHQHYHTSLLGTGVILSEDEIADTAKGFTSYGRQPADDG